VIVWPYYHRDNRSLSGTALFCPKDGSDYYHSYLNPLPLRQPIPNTCTFVARSAMVELVDYIGIKLLHTAYEIESSDYFILLFYFSMACDLFNSFKLWQPLFTDRYRSFTSSPRVRDKSKVHKGFALIAHKVPRKGKKADRIIIQYRLVFHSTKNFRNKVFQRESMANLWSCP